MTTTKRHVLLSMALHDVITLDQLREAGFTRSERRTFQRREWLFQRHAGVYLTTDRPSYKTRCLAAVKHCGDDAQACCDSSGFLWEVIEEPEGHPCVTVPAHRMTHGANGIRVHRSRRPDPGWTRDLIPVTTLVRTIDDIARTRSVNALKAIVGRAERKHALALDELHAGATSPKLRRVLETYTAGRGLTDSELEARFLDIVTAAALPRPQRQRHQAGGRVDFLWPELGLIVEVDGYATHRGKVAFAEDRARDRAHWRAGLQTLRYTWADVVLTPGQIVADLKLAVMRVA